ncbi:MAG TPA: hypoxanthine-guanine phosphoribosyltransferase [Burkholderiales bacterium]|nr:hypoxanthine-guanine phosphoribosyltransferase [Burkholderiales bacterium]
MDFTPQQARDLLRSAQLVCPAEAVNAAVTRVAINLNRALHDAYPLVLCVMRGALVFAGHLLPQLDFPLEVDTLDVTRYRNATQGGELAFRAMPVAAVAGRTVLLIDDILDEGVTLASIRTQLMAQGALRVLIAVFAVKAIDRDRPVVADFYGVILPNRYVFGFGMDVHGFWRNLPAVYALEP